MTEPDALLPCPFCGGEAEWNLGKKGDDTPWRYLACGVCEAMGPHVADWKLSAHDAAHNDAILIAAWNTRAPLPPVTQNTAQPFEEPDREPIDGVVPIAGEPSS